MDKTIRRVTDAEEQVAETFRYWQSRSVGERLLAVCERANRLMLLLKGFEDRVQMMTKDFKDLLRAFNANAVKYLIIGAHAFGVYAEPRATKNLDLFIRSDEENARATFKALAEFGTPLEGLTAQDFADGSAFQIGQPPDRIDILQKIDGISFEEAWPNRVEGTIDGEVTASIISLEDLIRNKLAAGREQDILDVKTLRKAADTIQRKESR